MLLTKTKTQTDSKSELTEAIIRRLAEDGPLSPYDFKGYNCGTVRRRMAKLEQEGLLTFIGNQESAKGGIRNTYWLTSSGRMNGIIHALVKNCDIGKLRGWTKKIMKDQSDLDFYKALFYFHDKNRSAEAVESLLAVAGAARAGEIPEFLSLLNETLKQSPTLREEIQAGIRNLAEGLDLICLPKEVV